MAKVFPRLETERLFLDQLQVHHAQDYLAIRSDAHVMSTTAMRLLKSDDINRAEKLITQQANKFERGNFISWGIFSRESSKLIGYIFFQNISKHSLWVEIGYFLAHDIWGNGYMTEALSPAIDYCFESCGLNRIQAWTFDDNIASQRVLEKNNFQHEGTFRDYIRHADGTLKTIHYYARLKSDD